MRFLRVENPEALSPRPGSNAGEVMPEHVPPPEEMAPETVRTHQVIGGPTGTAQGGVTGERLDALAQKAYGDPSRWRWLAAFNRIEDPLRIPAGQVVQIPSLEQRSQT
jgi:hypothetical protein